MALKYKIDKIPEYYWLNQETSNLADDEKRFHSLIGQLKKLKEMVGKKGFRNICINSQDDIGRSPLYKVIESETIPLEISSIDVNYQNLDMDISDEDDVMIIADPKPNKSSKRFSGNKNYL